VNVGSGSTDNARFSSFRIEAMDCPTEQTLIQNKLGKMSGIQKLEFNLINRVLGVWHELPSTDPIRGAIGSVGMQTDEIEEGARQETLVAIGIVRCRCRDSRGHPFHRCRAYLGGGAGGAGRDFQRRPDDL